MDLSKTIGEQSGNAKNHLESVIVTIIITSGPLTISQGNPRPIQLRPVKP